MPKVFNIFIFIAALVLGYGLFSSVTNFTKTETRPLAAISSPGSVSDVRGLSKVESALEPVSFSIPSIDVENAKVESVGLDKENKMDIPKDENNVAWYNLGVKPGETGNAVIAGHYDKKSGDPSVFYNINKLKPGDELIVTDEKGKELVFAVTEVKTYELSDFPLQEVFGIGTKPRLNLITCEGNFDTSSKLYSHRLVVYSELKS